MGQVMRIGIIGRGDGDPAISFAACELQKYAAAITGGTVEIDGSSFAAPASGTAETHAVPDDTILIGLSFAEDEAADDCIHIDVAGNRGVIGGSNPRSVLFAVYRYLHELGCRWVRPGKAGEYVPSVPGIASRRVKLTERAAYRYRAICIEGAVSLENVTDMIDWMPKVGFNSYFIQFRDAYVFFRRWYRHTNNPFFPAGDAYEVEEARACVRAAEAEIVKRGLIYQAVGHGWTCEPFGIPGLSWDAWEGAGQVDEQTRQYFALVDGERKLWGDVPLNTNLCYSNPRVRQMMTTDIARYAAEHPHMDIVHVWLADGTNNYCECAECRRMLPSDWYVRLLNELDRELSGRKLPTRIACIVYQDLLWPPLSETLLNPRRFLLLIAPFDRSYRESFAGSGEVAAIPEYVHNKLVMPTGADAYIAFLKRWQRDFPGEAVDFDYHFMWAHHRDPGYTTIARVLHEDIRSLRQMGLSGYISCQVQRAFFPNGLGMTVMGRTLWNPGLSFDEAAGDYFRSAYGRDGDECRSYLQHLSDLFAQLDLEQAGRAERTGPGEVFSHIDERIRGFAPLIADNLSRDGGRGHACHAASWNYLRLHAALWLELARALQALYGGDRDQAQAVWHEVRRKLWEEEEQYQPVFDVFDFVRTWDAILH